MGPADIPGAPLPPITAQIEINAFVPEARCKPRPWRRLVVRICNAAMGAKAWFHVQLFAAAVRQDRFPVDLTKNQMPMSSKLFTVVQSRSGVTTKIRRHAYLVSDNWDDWNKFQTMFTLCVVDADGAMHVPGRVKIGEVGLQARSKQEPTEPGFRTPTLPQEFDRLPIKHFSIGETENYYETLNELEPIFKDEILVGLRDCAFDLTIFDAHHDEEVMSESLLRGIPESNVHNRFYRLAHGDAVLTCFEFKYKFPDPGLDGVDPPTLSFVVRPNSEPPTNVHVLIGCNGVGKTRCVQNMSRAVLGVADEENPSGELRPLDGSEEDWTFAGLVFVSFSLFDDFDLPPVSESTKIRSTQVGRRFVEDARLGSAQDQAQVKISERLGEEFAGSFGQCRTGPRSKRWLAAVETLEADPLFEEAAVGELLTLSDDEWEAAAKQLFKRLSSGHAIVLLTTTRLVELVDERSLVILDEPEGHLHPPLLAAFVRTVADLMVKRNGVALIATHSPVVLQEVPKSCVWKLRRAGPVAVAERPLIETFGENVGVLTREVFGLEVTNSGFHNLLRRALAEKGSYDATLQHFNGQLGAEARAILMALAVTSRQP